MEPKPYSVLPTYNVKTEVGDDSKISQSSSSLSSAFVKFSRNCKKFNRLFHSSFDDEDSSSSTSTSNLDDRYTPPEIDCKVKTESLEILLEIEIETETTETLIQGCTVINQNECNFTNMVKNEIQSIEPCGDNDEDEIKLAITGTGSNSSKRSLTKKKSGRLGTRTGQRKSTRLPQIVTSGKTQEAHIMRRITGILKKDSTLMTAEDQSLLDAFPTLVRIVQKRFEARLLSSERLKEFEDSPLDLEAKCNQLAHIISNAKYLVVYSGAGISTSANIPDYRGACGLWTMLKNGQPLDSQSLDTQIITSADPTTTHMALYKLYSDGIIKHIVSQNCDGLHLRSGIPKMGLSEVHGNMYIEVCVKCQRDYVRTFDVAENTRRYEHRTGRRCYNCANPLRDSIVHFGERGKLRWPINWAGAEYNAHRADVIVCIGSSLKVLRRYPWLWQMDKPASKRPKLVIVNLMWTPKDQFAVLKIHGRCDDVMARVMSKLNVTIPSYRRVLDPLFRISTPLHLSEIRTRSSRGLTFPENEPFPNKLVDMNNYIQFEAIFRGNSSLQSSEEDISLDSDEDSITTPKLIGRKSRSPTNGKPNNEKGKCKDRIIRKGNGTGWLGNLTPGVKVKRRKLK